MERLLTVTEIEEFADGWAPDDGRIDWDDYLFRLEVTYHVDLPESLSDPEIRRIQRITRRAIRARQ